MLLSGTLRRAAAFDFSLSHSFQSGRPCIPPRFKAHRALAGPGNRLALQIPYHRDETDISPIILKSGEGAKDWRKGIFTSSRPGPTVSSPRHPRRPGPPIRDLGRTALREAAAGRSLHPDFRRCHYGPLYCGFSLVEEIPLHAPLFVPEPPRLDLPGYLTRAQVKELAAAGKRNRLARPRARAPGQLAGIRNPSPDIVVAKNHLRPHRCGASLPSATRRIHQ